MNFLLWISLYPFSKFASEQKSLKFLLEIMAVVPSADNIGSDTEYIMYMCECLLIY